jgi:acyl-CoA synthetase (AMP-forming)/AMP-acid ligase II
MTQLVHELIYESASRHPDAPALRYIDAQTSYAALAAMVEAAGAGLRALGAQPGDRVALYLPKREEAVCALFGAAAAGCAFVALDPSSTPYQVGAVLRDSGARVLVSSAERIATLADELPQCPLLRTLVVCGAPGMVPEGLELVHWDALVRAGAPAPADVRIDDDMAALVYMQAGPRPNAVALSHRNLVATARALQRCLRLRQGDRLLAALPLSADFGLHQLSASFAAGSTAVLLNPMRARDVVRAVDEEGIAALAALPASWGEMAQLAWPRGGESLRVAVNAGGALPAPTVAALRRLLPRARLVLMYGQAEAFRATCLGQEEMEERPGSIGRPLPHAGVMVLRPDGSQCQSGEAGELVQRGPLVAQGYWNDAARTRDSFRYLPARRGLALRETAFWTGQTVTLDEDGFLYPARAGDDIIRTGGRRVRAGDIEEIVHGTGLVEEVAAFGVAHPLMGQVVAVLARARAGGALDSAQLFDACRARLPEHMLPAMVDVRRAPLPRGRGGQIDRNQLAGELAMLFSEVTQ